MTDPLRNEAVEHNTREAMRTFRAWKRFRAFCFWSAIILAAILAICFSR